MSPGDAKSFQDEDTREHPPVERAGSRGVGWVLVLLLCAASACLGYVVGRRPQKKASVTIVDSQQVPVPKKALPPPLVLAGLASVTADEEPTTVVVRFDGRVARLAAENPVHYSITPDVEVTAAALGPDSRTVTLTTSPLDPAKTYRLTVANVGALPVELSETRAIFRYIDTRRVTTGLVAFYTLEEGQGDLVQDVSRVAEPLNLKVRDPQNVSWVPGGLAVRKSTIVGSAGPGGKIFSRCRETNAITIEAWIKPASTSQGGPSRIVTLSRGGQVRNFTLGQEGARYDVRLRTTENDENGCSPSMPSKGGVETRLTHVVYTRSAEGRATVYLDGKKNAEMTIPGSLSNWEGSFQFGLANEFVDDRTWLGEIHLVAIYDRALTAEEVQQNFSCGANEGKR
jgi:hypothetical protein